VIFHLFARAWDQWNWWWLHATGSDNPSGPEYGFWSGFGSFVPFLVPISVWYWRHTCHVKSCPWPAAHAYEMDGVTIKLCPKHHPAIDGSRAKAANIQAHYDARQAE
jgi:hypothetical protein